MELATLGFSGDGERLLVACDGAVATLRVELASGRAFPVEVRVDMHETPLGARERLVALAATELLAQTQRGRRAETGRTLEPSAVAAVAEPPTPKPSAGHRKRRHGSLWLGGSASLMGEPRTLLLGGRLGSELALSPAWAVALDFQYQGGETQLPAADVRWARLTVSVGLLREWELGPFRLAVGGALEGGRLALRAAAREPDLGRDVAGTWWSAVVPLRAALRLGQHSSLLLALEGGYLLTPLRGNFDTGERLIEASGAWATAGLGAAWEF